MLTLLGLLGMGGLAVLGLARLRPVRAFSLAVFVLRFAIALAVILVFGAVPVQDFQTMYDAACQMAQGGGDYLRTDYFYNWAYQTGFTAYEKPGDPPVWGGAFPPSAVQRPVDGRHWLSGVRHRPAVFSPRPPP